MGFERHHSALIVASLVTVVSFVGATAYTQNRLARLDALSSAIETSAAPSIEHLSHAAVRLTKLSQLLDDATAVREPRAPLAAARQEVIALEHDIAAYVRLPPLPRERPLLTELRSDVDGAVRLVRSAIEAEHQSAAGPAARDRADAALDRAARSVLASLEFDIRQSERMARDVRQVRVTTLRMIVALDAAATAIALVAVIVAYRASRRHDQLLRAHASLLDARVTELDHFAGRVAHDVLTPLGTVAVALPLLAQSCEGNARGYIDRSQRALQRVQQLVEGLLLFARSGARPDPSARCAVDGVTKSIAAECSEATVEQGIDLVLDIEEGAPLVVPCSPGVIASIVDNLVRNAIKYIGAGPVKRIVVRARATGETVRLEVEDTGPGVPPELQPTIFDPFVRGAHDDVAGTGLGLATVKRLVEAHGGAIGVRSTAGAGSLFWIELPIAAASIGEGSSVAVERVV